MNKKKSKIIITDCTSCSHCKKAKVANGHVPLNWKHLCTKRGDFAITKKNNGVFVVGIKYAATCPDYLPKDDT